jgi:protein-disulfide isomerase
VAAGARADAVQKAIDSHSHAREIEADSDLADDFQADGTPHFFVNGRRLVGAQPQEKFDAVIDDEIKKAQDLLAKGTRAEAVYDALIRDGKGAPPPETKQLPKSLPPGDPARGNQNARVTIHEWSDFQCPFCQRVEPTLTRLLKEYAGRVRLVWHDLPLPMHPDAPLAARAAREAYKQKGQRAFWQMHDKLFEDQNNLKRDTLDGYARELMLDMDRWNAVLVGAEKTGVLEGDRQAAEDMGITGTPAFVVVPGHANAGYFLSGAQSYPKFRKLVDRALGEAK